MLVALWSVWIILVQTHILHTSHYTSVFVVAHTLQDVMLSGSFHLHRFHREVLAPNFSSPEEPQSVFIAGQLFSILDSMDFTDEVGRFVMIC